MLLLHRRLGRAHTERHTRHVERLGRTLAAVHLHRGDERGLARAQLGIVGEVNESEARAAAAQDRVHVPWRRTEMPNLRGISPNELRQAAQRITLHTSQLVVVEVHVFQHGQLGEL